MLSACFLRFGQYPALPPFLFGGFMEKITRALSCISTRALSCISIRAVLAAFLGVIVCLSLFPLPAKGEREDSSG